MRIGRLAFSALGVLLAAAGIVAPIVWDQYKAQSAIEVQQTAVSRLVARAEGVEKLQFSYDGKHVSDLSKIDVRIINTGRHPIRKDSVVSPVLLTIRGATLLDARIEGLHPSDAIARTIVAPDRNGVVIEFDLLNPSDWVDLGLLVSGGTASVVPSGRIAGVSQLRLVNHSAGTFRQRLPWAVYVVGPFTILGVMLFIGLIHMLGQEKSVAQLAEKTAIFAPITSDPAGSLTLLDHVLGQLKKHELKALRAKLAGFPAGTTLTEEQQQALRIEFLAKLQDRQAVRGAFLFITFLTALGLGYSVRALWLASAAG